MQQYDCKNFFGTWWRLLAWKRALTVGKHLLIIRFFDGQGDHEDEVSASLSVLLPPQPHVPQLL